MIRTKPSDDQYRDGWDRIFNNDNVDNDKKERQDAYFNKLKDCGFRSWKQANMRRFELICKKTDEYLTVKEELELDQLQALTDLYVKYKTDDSMSKTIKSLKEIETEILKNKKAQSPILIENLEEGKMARNVRLPKRSIPQRQKITQKIGKKKKKRRRK